MRIGAGAVLVLAAVATVSPRLLSYVATSAVVNARVATITAPYAGMITEPSRPIGNGVVPGLPLLRLRIDTDERIGFVNARNEMIRTSAEVEGIAGERQALEALRSTLVERAGRMREHTTAYLAAAITEGEAEVRSAELAYAYLRDDLARNEMLARNGAVSSVSRDEIRKEMGQAQAVLAARLAAVEGDHAAQAALAEGVAVDSVGDGLNTLQGRIDDIDQRLAALEHDSLVANASMKAASDELDGLGTSMIGSYVYAPMFRNQGVVWFATPPAGAHVMAGQPLVRVLDCTNRFVQVALPERYFDDIAIGNIARVRLKGAGDWIEGRVMLLVGSNVDLTTEEAVAAELPVIGDGQMGAMVSLPPVDVGNPRVAATNCDVGRTADVRIEPAGRRQGPLARMLEPWVEWVVAPLRDLHLFGRAPE